MNAPTMTALPRGQLATLALKPKNHDRFPWQDGLPKEWWDMAIAPLYLRHYKEYEIQAERSLGYDEDNAPCFCTHRYQLSELRSEDGEEFYEATTYAEALTAWRLRDGRWLIHRIVMRHEDCRDVRGFYSFSETMPR
ncbi:MAG TPA: hypothetical protein VGK09_10040 [Rhodocyclaceae bacterium]|jgi:hypothetical protein